MYPRLQPYVSQVSLQEAKAAAVAAAAEAKEKAAARERALAAAGARAEAEKKKKKEATLYLPYISPRSPLDLPISPYISL